MKKLSSSLLLVAIGSWAMAQTPMVAPPEPLDPAIDEGEKAITLLDNFLSDKGWSEGIVQVGKKKIIIKKGVGQIAAPPTHSSYIDSRRLAFDKAMLEAKAKMANFLEQEIAIAVERKYSDNDSSHTPTPQEEIADAMAAMPSESICGKAIRLLDAKLDNALKAEGVDFAAEKQAGGERLQAAINKAKKLCGSGSFKKTISSSATCCVSGLQAYYVIESQRSGKQGEIGVIAMWSPALSAMADSLVTGKAVPVKAAKRPIREQIPKDKNVLLSTFGVQQKIDENGQLVLVAYGQAGARSKSGMASNAAYAKARLQASALIRQFAGETVSMAETQQEAEESFDYGEDLPDYSDASSYEVFQRSVAAKMKINGIATIKNWTAIHPVSKKPAYGCICTWSPAGASLARKMKKQIESTGKSGAAGLRTVPFESDSTAKESSGSGSSANRVQGGAVGDDDAF